MTCQQERTSKECQK